MIKKEETYQVINKRIAQNIAELADKKGISSLSVDDCLIAAWEALVFLDVNSLSSNETKLQHVKSILPLLKRKKVIARYQNYTREALQEALYKERLLRLQEEEDYKCLCLSDIKIIDHIDDQGKVYLNKKLYDIYKNIAPTHIAYGVMPYTGDVSKATRRILKRERLPIFTIEAPVEKVLAPFIQDYCDHWDFVVSQEHYKWDAVKKFTKVFNIGAKNLGKNLKEAMSPADNLLAGPFYFPLSMLVQMANFDSERTRQALQSLFDGTENIGEKADRFIEETNAILEDGKRTPTSTFKPNDKSMQSLRSISVYLSLYHPAKHYLYKQSVYYDFLSITGADLPRLSGYDNYLNTYETICDAIRELLVKNEELIKKHNASYPDDVSDYHLLTQDFMYYCATYFQNLHS